MISFSANLTECGVGTMAILLNHPVRVKYGSMEKTMKFNGGREGVYANGF